MTEKQLRKLRRSELLEMLLEIERENETLAEESRAVAGYAQAVANLDPDRYKEVFEAAELLFTTVDGAVYRYIVTNRETVRPTDNDYMINNASPQAEPWDLTLFTCNTGGQTRCAVRCVRADALA